jgi:hypothetical protein
LLADPAANRSADLDAEGGFVFDAVPVGTYRVTANVAGYYPREVQANVVEGEPVRLQILVAPRPSREPYVAVSSWNGFNPCGFAFIVTPANICDERITNVTSGGPPRTGRNYTIPDGFAAVVGETEWKGSDEASAYYYNRSQERKNKNESNSLFSSVLDVAQGRNPLRVFLIPGQQRENSTQGVLAAYYGKVSEGGAFELRYALWWNGYYGDQFQALNAVCNQFAVPKCTGVGATINFRFTQWMSIFMYDRPGDIKSYSVISDT